MKSRTLSTTLSPWPLLPFLFQTALALTVPTKVDTHQLSSLLEVCRQILVVIFPIITHELLTLFDIRDRRNQYRRTGPLFPVEYFDVRLAAVVDQRTQFIAGVETNTVQNTAIGIVGGSCFDSLQRPGIESTVCERYPRVTEIALAVPRSLRS